LFQALLGEYFPPRDEFHPLFLSFFSLSPFLLSILCYPYRTSSFLLLGGFYTLARKLMPAWLGASCFSPVFVEWAGERGKHAEGENFSPSAFSCVTFSRDLDLSFHPAVFAHRLQTMNLGQAHCLTLRVPVLDL
jgi:hypothetical protein